MLLVGAKYSGLATRIPPHAALLHVVVGMRRVRGLRDHWRYETDEVLLQQK